MAGGSQLMALRGLGAAALLAGLASFAAGSVAQEFELVETPSVTQLPVAQLKPRAIVFSDKPGDDLIDPAVGFIRYEDWAKARPVQAQFLGLYPGYSEPNVDIIVDGTRRRYREKLHMYVAEARFVISRPPASLKLAQLATLPFAERIDPAIKHRLATAADQARPREARVVHNLQHPQRKWCEGREVVICLHSTYKLEGRLPIGIQLANKIREGSRRISDTLEFDSELTVLSAAEVTELGLAKLTQLDTAPVGALEQSIFYVNQVMQFGKLLAVFQAHPSDPGKTVVSIFTALAIESNLLGKQKQFANVPVMRNLVPALVLSGRSSFNSGKSLSAGLPVYARNQIRAIAAILEAGGQAAGKPTVNPVR
jgi:hypothetical protein